MCPLEKTGEPFKEETLNEDSHYENQLHANYTEDIYKLEVKKLLLLIKKLTFNFQERLLKNCFYIKHGSKSLYAYVRSKHIVQDNVGPLDGSDGRIISECFLLSENLNEYFISVFTMEDIGALPVLETMFEGRESTIWNN